MYKSMRLAQALENGNELSSNQIRSRFKIANPSATISDLRIDHGYKIKLNSQNKYVLNRARTR